MHNITTDNYSEFIQTVFKHQYLVEAAIAKTAELDKQADLDEAKFILSLA